MAGGNSLSTWRRARKLNRAQPEYSALRTFRRKVCSRNPQKLDKRASRRRKRASRPCTAELSIGLHSISCLASPQLAPSRLLFHCNFFLGPPKAAENGRLKLMRARWPPPPPSHCWLLNLAAALGRRQITQPSPTSAWLAREQQLLFAPKIELRPKPSGSKYPPASLGQRSAGGSLGCFLFQLAFDVRRLGLLSRLPPL